MPGYSVPTICETLERHRQRATYGAVADLVGKPAQSVMQPFQRSRRYSWVVNSETGLPSKYHDLQKHPQLLERDRILSSGDELAAWLAAPT
jgi:alkylated DNA nucleotide flippase Atl1